MSALLLGLLVVGAITVAWRASYHGWPWQQPERVSWCGREYDAAPKPAAAKVAPIHPVGRYPPVVGRRLFSDDDDATLERRRRSGSACAIVVYLSVGNDRYRPYELSGGP